MPSKMHLDRRPAIGSLALKTLSAAIASALLFSNAYAAGLGKLTVLSPLGQPLRAEIELTSVSKEENGALVAKLASPDAFRQANIDYNPALGSLRFAIEQRGERQFIRLTSSQPLNEPFVDMLLELSGPNGRLIREYTFLLDPADLRMGQSPQVAPVPVPQVAGGRAAQTESAAPAPAVQPAPARKPPREATPRVERPAPQQVAEAQVNEYQVRGGDSLGKIARRVKPAGVSLDQMLVALYQTNPDAFVGQNMNRLKAGEILSVPSAEAAKAVSPDEARSIVVAQAADFNHYRNKLAGQVASAAAQKTAEARQSAGGKIAAKIEEQSTPASESKDKLKLSNALPAASAESAEADRIAQEKAVAEANARVKELERNVSELQKLLEVKNKSLAEQQKQAEAPKAETKTASTEAAPATTQEKQAAVDTGAKEAGGEKPAPTPPVASTPPAPAAKPKPVTPPPPPPEPSFFDDLMENPLVLPGLGAILVALGALGIYRARRQKQSKSFEDSIITDSSLKANSLFGSTGGQNVDTNNSVFNSSFSPSASQLDTNEVDPVAEADVYIAYGRDAQAEEILKEALRTQPDRHAVRVKLLEIYSNRKDLRAFEVLATELYGLTKGEGEEWAQAVALGSGIDPNNPLYAGDKAGKNDGEKSGTVPAAMVAPTQPLDEQGLATLLSTTQSGASLVEGEDALDTDASYFDNTALDADKPLELPAEPEPEAMEQKDDVEKISSNDLDFDLDGLSLPQMEASNISPPPAPIQAPADLASIDFDFLDKPVEPASTFAPEQAAGSAMEPLAELEPEPTPVPEIQDLEFKLSDDEPIEQTLSDDVPPKLNSPVEEIASLEIPELDELPPATEAKVEAAAADPLDFDLSGISLELSPAEAGDKPDLDLGKHDDALADYVASDSAEMATKLDLAIAYQEIGDKEGARELLDEVLKGGTPEQSEKAKSLLLELA